MNLSLEQNAADSLNRSVAYFAENTPSGLKAAVKELVSAMELYVKAQLARLDVDPSNPVLVYERLKIEVADDPPRRHVLTPIGVNTVRFDDALKRLEWLGHEVATTDGRVGLDTRTWFLGDELLVMRLSVPAVASVA